MSAALQLPMVVAAARVLCKRSAEACNVNEADLWYLESEAFKEEALAALEAAGAPELLTALQAVINSVPFHHSHKDVHDRALAAIAATTGSQA